MVNRLYTLAFALLLLVAHAWADDVSVTTLPSGLKVIVREGNSTDLAALDIWVRAGAVNELPEKCGTAHFIEHMIFKATDRYGPGQLDREIEGVGADLNAGTTHDYAHFYTTVPSDALPTALNALADAVVNAVFREEEVEKERRVILDELARSEADPFQYALDRVAGLLYLNHPYGRPQVGSRATIARITRDDLVAFHRAYFTPANTTVVIAGRVRSADVVALVERAFAGFDRPSSPRVSHPEQSLDAPRIQSLPHRSAQAHVAVAFRAPGIADFREVCVMDVIEIVLGGTAHGRIADALVREGVPFTKIRTDYVTRRDPSFLAVIAAVEPEYAEKARAAIVSEIRRPGVTEDEVSYARRLIEGRYLFEQETLAGRARALGFYETIASCDIALKYVPTVRAITVGDVESVAAKYFASESYAAVTLVSEASE